MSVGDWARGFTMYHLRTAVYTAVTCVAIFAVWYTGHQSTQQLRVEHDRACVQTLRLTQAVDDLHTAIKKFLIAARDARLKSPHTKNNLEAAREYQQILDHISVVPLPECHESLNGS